MSTDTSSSQENNMCGVAGAFGTKDAAIQTRHMLHALQNRGRDGCGILTLDGDEKYVYRGRGTVSSNLTEEVLSTLIGNMAIGQTRYATAKKSNGDENLQPFYWKVDGQTFAFVHNGQFTNIEELEAGPLKGSRADTASDSERFLTLVQQEYRDTDTIEAAVVAALAQMRGSCSGLLMLPGKMLAIKDPSRNRPLYWCKNGKGEYYVASETSALDALGQFFWQEIAPGTIVSFSESGVAVTEAVKNQRESECTFEYVYFRFPTSKAFKDVSVSEVRHALGAAMARTHYVHTDLIIGVPDSAMEMAVGYAEAIECQLDFGAMLRRHDTGRTFIKKGQGAREKAVAEKFAFDTTLISGKSVTLIDDSLVRGTTSRGITQALRKRGATEVHWRIPSPPIIASCIYGINTADESKLLARERELEEMRKEIHADSLQFLTLPAFKLTLESCGFDTDKGCFSCMDGVYW